MPLDIRSVDMMIKEPQTPEEASIHLFNGPEQGLVSIGPITMIEQNESGLFEVKAVLCKDEKGELLAGDLLLEMAVQGAKVRLAGSFTLYREGSAEPAVPSSEPVAPSETQTPTSAPTAAATEAPSEKPGEAPVGGVIEIPAELEEPEELDFLWIYSTNDPNQLPDGAVELELTETAFIDYDTKEESTSATAIVASLREMGYAIAMDDFCTGYSSIAMLQRLPMDVMKIDRSMLLASEQSARGQKILKNVVNFGTSLDMLVLCEGIETEAQEKLLLDNGCTYGQGFLFSRPMPNEKYIEFIEEHDCA